MSFLLISGNLVLFLVTLCSGQPEQRSTCLISRVSLPSTFSFRLQIQGVVGESDAGAGSLSWSFRGYHSDTSEVG